MSTFFISDKKYQSRKYTIFPLSKIHLSKKMILHARHNIQCERTFMAGFSHCVSVSCGVHVDMTLAHEIKRLSDVTTQRGWKKFASGESWETRGHPSAKKNILQSSRSYLICGRVVGKTGSMSHKRLIIPIFIFRTRPSSDFLRFFQRESYPIEEKVNKISDL